VWKNSQHKFEVKVPKDCEILYDWLKREGEERYFYKDLESLLIFFAEKSIKPLKEYKEIELILSPISSDSKHIEKAERPKYQALLEESAFLEDESRNAEKFCSHKNIIHFQIMPLKKGIQVLEEIAKELGFQNLKKLCSNLCGLSIMALLPSESLRKQ
jgi:hypothetical protein